MCFHMRRGFWNWVIYWAIKVRWKLGVSLAIYLVACRLSIYCWNCTASEGICIFLLYLMNYIYLYLCSTLYLYKCTCFYVWNTISVLYLHYIFICSNVAKTVSVSVVEWASGESATNGATPPNLVNLTFILALKFIYLRYFLTF